MIELENDHIRVVIAEEVGAEVRFLGRPGGDKSRLGLTGERLCRHAIQRRTARARLTGHPNIEAAGKNSSRTPALSVRSMGSLCRFTARLPERRGTFWISRTTPSN